MSMTKNNKITRKIIKNDQRSNFLQFNMNHTLNNLCRSPFVTTDEFRKYANSSKK